MFETILCSINHNHESLKAAKQAIQLAKDHESRLIMLRINRSKSATRTLESPLKSVSREIKQEIEESKINCDIIEREGKQVFVICDVAKQFNVDLIVMSASESHLEASGMNIPKTLVELSPCPVLVIP